MSKASFCPLLRQLMLTLLYLKKWEVCFPFAQTRSLPMSLSPPTQSYQQILHLQDGTATLFWPGASSCQLPSGFYSQPVSTYPTCLSSGKLLGTVSSLSQFRTWFSSELSRSLPFPSGLRDSVWSALFYSPAQTSKLVCCIPHSGMLLHQISALSTSIFSETFPGLTPLSPSPTKALSVHTLGKERPHPHHQALVLILCPCFQSSSYHQQGITYILLMHLLATSSSRSQFFEGKRLLLFPL